MKLANVLIKPKITEKSVEQAKKGVYTFIADQNGTKDEIKKIVADMFKVTVKDIKTYVKKGKEKRVSRTNTKKRASIKIAYVKVEGKIDLFPQSLEK